MYQNIEKRQVAVTQRRDARYRGWDASGRFWYIVKSRNHWYADLRDNQEANHQPRVYGKTLREISAKLSSIRKPVSGAALAWGADQ